MFVALLRRLENQGEIMEFMTITGIENGKRYIAIYRKWFNEKMSAWELNLVPGTLRWLNDQPLQHDHH
ncbi:MAG: hypothetical protein HY231_17370 [Acidobacteria bacterium]|nr:hypothetical protein [Acidobacteriota bacterium]